MPLTTNEKIQLLETLRKTVDVALDFPNKDKGKVAIKECIEQAIENGIGYKVLFLDEIDYEVFLIKLKASI